MPTKPIEGRVLVKPVDSDSKAVSGLRLSESSNGCLVKDVNDKTSCSKIRMAGDLTLPELRVIRSFSARHSCEWKTVAMSAQLLRQSSRLKWPQAVAAIDLLYGRGLLIPAIARDVGGCRNFHITRRDQFVLIGRGVEIAKKMLKRRSRRISQLKYS